MRVIVYCRKEARQRLIYRQLASHMDVDIRSGRRHPVGHTATRAINVAYVLTLLPSTTAQLVPVAQARFLLGRWAVAVERRQGERRSLPSANFDVTRLEHENLYGQVGEILRSLRRVESELYSQRDRIARLEVELTARDRTRG